jgi:superkiller protein 3
VEAGTPRPHNSLGNALKNKGRLEEAIAEYREAIRLKKDDPVPHINLGVLLCDQKHDYDGAIAAFREAIRLKKDYPVAHSNLGNALTAKGRLDEAIACYQKAIELDPKLACAHNGLGVSLEKKGKLDEAIACYQKAIELNPRHFLAHRNLAQVLHARGKVKEAIASCRQAIELAPREAEAHRLLGTLLADQGRYGEAVDSYREALRLDPQDHEALNNLAWLLANCPEPGVRNPARAVQLAKQAVELASKEGSCWNTLGAAQYRAGNWKEAVAALERSMRLRDGGDAFDWLFHAMAQWHLGQKDEARTRYDRAVQWMEKNAPKDEELRRLRAEAEGLLGKKAP